VARVVAAAAAAEAARALPKVKSRAGGAGGRTR
ncbi:MAG: hypothetical protein JWQ13_3964, partial [Ramlibacter sp.]|nr:hypothetical protein [Ramlibacter sp.]